MTDKKKAELNTAQSMFKPTPSNLEKVTAAFKKAKNAHKKPEFRYTLDR